MFAMNIPLHYSLSIAEFCQSGIPRNHVRGRSTWLANVSAHPDTLNDGHTNFILRAAKAHILKRSQPWRNREIWVVP
jgi:hypothetical protein